MHGFLRPPFTADEIFPKAPELKIPDGSKLPALKSALEYAFEVSVKEIQAFENTLTDTEAVSSLLASFGQSILLSIRSVKLFGQYICMEGVTSDGEDATLVQHYTQTSMLLGKVTIEGPHRPIGFTAG